jgi:Fe-S-cluster containining protein
VAATPVLTLNIHAGYECCHSGACCTAGWPIPVEPEAVCRIRSAAGLSRDVLMTLDQRPDPAARAASEALPGEALHVTGVMPDGAAAVIAPLPGGACPFFDSDSGRLCAIQRRLGHDALPASCRHFPRVALLEPDAVRVTLSHFCPTAAWMLLKPDLESLAIVDDAEGIADRDEHSGFDARQTIPPLLRPGVATDGGTCRLWEGYLVAALDSADLTAEDMLAGVASTADMIRRWAAGRDSLEAHTRNAVAAAAAIRPLRGRWGMTLTSASRLFMLAVGSIPPGLARPEMLEGAEAVDRAWVRPQWADLSRPLGRYLAARSFGAWSAYLGEGLRTQVAALAVALAAVRVEAVREATHAARPLDIRMLHAAIRSADLLLHHLSDPAMLVKGLAGAERGSFPDSLAFMGLEAVP